MLSESYLSLKELVEILNVPENSIKLYMTKHPEFIRFDKVHNRYRVHVSAVETLRTIRRLYGDGLKREAVDEYLRGSGVPVTITVDSEDTGGKSLVHINEEVAELKNMLTLQNQLLQKVVLKLDDVEKERVERERLLLQEIQESKQLHQQEIGEVKQLLNRHESERVSELRLSMEESKRAMEEVSASVEVIKEEVEAERKKGFFQKLFSR